MAIDTLHYLCADISTMVPLLNPWVREEVIEEAVVFWGIAVTPNIADVTTDASLWIKTVFICTLHSQAFALSFSKHISPFMSLEKFLFHLFTLKVKVKFWLGSSQSTGRHRLSFLYFLYPMFSKLIFYLNQSLYSKTINSSQCWCYDSSLINYWGTASPNTLPRKSPLGGEWGKTLQDRQCQWTSGITHKG